MAGTILLIVLVAGFALFPLLAVYQLVARGKVG
jgi:hypothetical protein